MISQPSYMSVLPGCVTDQFRGASLGKDILVTELILCITRLDRSFVRNIQFLCIFYVDIYTRRYSE